MEIEIIKYSICALFILLAAINDYRYYKIKNKLVLTFLVIGLIFNLVTGGASGGVKSIYACLIPLALFPLFALKMLGAGDIKAFCAIGSILGLTQIIYIVLFSFLGGGVIAVFFLIFRQNALERFKAFAKYIKMCFYLRKLLPYSEFTDENSKFRFAYGILSGFIILVFASYNNYI